MPTTEEAHARLAGIPNLTVSVGAPLSRYTLFGIGGPADLYAETGSVEAFVAALVHPIRLRCSSTCRSPSTVVWASG